MAALELRADLVESVPEIGSRGDAHLSLLGGSGRSLGRLRARRDGEGNEEGRYSEQDAGGSSHGPLAFTSRAGQARRLNGTNA